MAGRLRKVLRKLAAPVMDRITYRVAARLPAPITIEKSIIVEKPAPPFHEKGAGIALSWGLKLYGSRLAREMYDARLQPLIDQPMREARRLPLSGKLCEQSDIESDWFIYWCREQKIAPIYHRKVWEDCFVLQAIWEAGLMREGIKGLCFGAGQEPLPSYLASRGVDVLATDLAPDAEDAKDWIETGQHATRELLFRPEIVERQVFESRVNFRHLNMNEIPDDLNGQFDFCWSLCSLEHVGSTELAVAFIIRAMDCLKPGGYAFHTTEFNLTSETETVTRGWCVIFTKPQIEAVCEKLRALGHEVFPVSFETGSQPLDQFVDLPPYPRLNQSPYLLSIPLPSHLRLALFDYVTTSIGFIVRKANIT